MAGIHCLASRTGYTGEAGVEVTAAQIEGTERALRAFWPQLSLLVHGGMPIEPYLPLLEPWFAGLKVDRREIYMASEGLIAIADRDPGEGLRLNLDMGMFFEFVPAGEIGTPAPRRFWIGNVEAGVDYAMVLTTCAGLWSYVIGDIVRFVDVEHPRILFSGRIGHGLSTFGEHLLMREIDTAVVEAGRTLGIGAGLLFAYLRASGQAVAIPRAQWPRLALIAFFSITCWNILVVFGLQHIPSGRAAILAYTMPAWSIPLSVLVLGERMTGAKLAGLVLGMGGMVLLLRDDFAGLERAPLGEDQQREVVLAAELILLVPSVSKARVDWLKARIEAAYLVSLALEAPEAEMIKPEEADRLLATAGILGVMIDRDGANVLVASPAADRDAADNHRPGKRHFRPRHRKRGEHGDRHAGHAEIVAAP